MDWRSDSRVERTCSKGDPSFKHLMWVGLRHQSPTGQGSDGVTNMSRNPPSRGWTGWLTGLQTCPEAPILRLDQAPNWVRNMS